MNSQLGVHPKGATQCHLSPSKKPAGLAWQNHRFSKVAQADLCSVPSCQHALGQSTVHQRGELIKGQSLLDSTATPIARANVASAAGKLATPGSVNASFLARQIKIQRSLFSSFLLRLGYLINVILRSPDFQREFLAIGFLAKDSSSQRSGGRLES